MMKYECPYCGRELNIPGMLGKGERACYWCSGAINPPQIMGRIKSAKKAAAVRENGKKGGRPAKNRTA